MRLYSEREKSKNCSRCENVSNENVIEGGKNACL